MNKWLKSMVRGFTRKPVTNLINLIGLTVSLMVVIILSVYCYSELTTESRHPNEDGVFLINNWDVHINARTLSTPALLKDCIDQSVPMAEKTVRVGSSFVPTVLQVGNNTPRTFNLLFADDGFFELFNYPVLEGNLKTALKEPMSLVLTRSFAEKLFGKESAVGKNVKYDNNRELTVKAVVDEQAFNTVFSFDALTTVETRKIVSPLENFVFEGWQFPGFQTFVLLKKGVRPEQFSRSLMAALPDDQKANFNKHNLMTTSALYFSKGDRYAPGYLRFGDKRKVMMLALVAVLVLLIALVNYINIASAQWHDRVSQNGIKKVLGAGRMSIGLNVVGEAGVLFLTALFLAIMLVCLASPFVANYAGIRFNTGVISSRSFLLMAAVVTFVLSTIFSLLPAWRIASSRAIDNLGKARASQHTSFYFRRLLVITQFVIAIVLIAFTVLVQKQVRFGSDQLGMHCNNVIGIRLTQQLGEKKEVLRKILEDKPGFETIAFTDYFPGSPLLRSAFEGKNGWFDYQGYHADANIFQIMGLQLVQGRFFSGNLSTDVGKVVVNESFMKKYNRMNPYQVKISDINGEWQIVGVVKNFHYQSISEPIRPLIIVNDSRAAYCLVNINASTFGSLHQAIQYIRAETARLSPAFPVEVDFFDQAVGKLYQSEVEYCRAFTLFSIVAMVLCCLGIFAMSLSACQRRIREIGIRKINGAGIPEIVMMLNKDFVVWVVVANLVAIPVSYCLSSKWLENFAYKTELSWWVFALSGLLAVVVAILTVSFQSWKAATRNPVEALRYE